MSNSPNLLLAVSGVFLVTWYGLRRCQGSGEYPRLSQEGQPYAPPIRQTHAALLAEFRDQSQDDQLYLGGKVACPDCGNEFQAGVVFCHCGSQTVDADDLDEAILTVHMQHDADFLLTHEKMICIYVVDNHWKASLLKGFLEHHDIPCSTEKGAGASATHFITGRDEIKLYVRIEHEGEARRLIADRFV